MGEGGFSVVYHGKCKQSDSAVAIKVVDKETSNLADVKNEIAIMVKTGIHPEYCIFTCCLRHGEGVYSYIRSCTRRRGFRARRSEGYIVGEVRTCVRAFS